MNILDIKLKDFKPKIYFSAEGIVLGNYWGGGKGYYKARGYQNNHHGPLIKEIQEALEKGSLDSGMGYESLIGARMAITAHYEIEIEGKKFFRHETEDKIFTNGKIAPGEMALLEDIDNL